MRVLSRRARTWAALATVAAVVTGAAAYAAIPGDDGEIAACYGKVSGIVRIIDAEAGKTCLPSENAVSWNQQGVQGPPGAEGPPGETVRGYRVLRATPDEVEVTAVGTAPIGLVPLGGGTHILAMHLPQGIYMADASIAARKAFGNGDFLCWVHNGTVASSFARTGLGDAPGHVKRNTVSGSGVFNVPAGGGTLTLECWQASTDVPGSPSGENPTVFYASLQATNVSSATIVRYPAGTTIQLP